MQALAGHPETARELIAELEERSSRGEYVSTISFLNGFLGLGERERALEILQKAFEAGASYLIALNVYELFDPLRDDPRFRSLVARVGLPH